LTDTHDWITALERLTAPNPEAISAGRETRGLKVAAPVEEVAVRP
jgi:hypothetical protein